MATLTYACMNSEEYPLERIPHHMTLLPDGSTISDNNDQLSLLVNE